MHSHLFIIADAFDATFDFYYLSNNQKVEDCYNKYHDPSESLYVCAIIDLSDLLQKENSMEIEKKYLVNAEDAKRISQGIKGKEIIQAYLEVGETERRVRQKGNIFYHTIKSGSGLARQEIEAEITEEEFKTAIKNPIGNIISKTRYNVGLGNDLTAELDIYHGALEGLYSVEVEFKTIEETENFQKPDWFGKDVTEDKRYKNQKLATNGIPKTDSPELGN